ncbi:hypothetical protein QSH57_000593 [Fusarium oxysporum f. sp. vasinfectum]|nr:hypothetical protein QSH57_000593 [Fusarium oxysporum f. sp. vasinfectum]
MTTDPFSGSSRPGIPSTSAVVGEAPIVPSVEAQHLARFEFSDAGTKVLMVEWYPDAVRGPAASANRPADTSDSGAGTAPASSSRHSRRRVFFLLPADATVPSTITITPPGSPSLTLKPLPAIFPPGLAADPGNRGVLHTLWARQRLAAIDREVAAELRNNAEGVGVEMALAERQWILDTFINTPQLPSDSMPRPVATRSPTGRLGDKLKGLKLATSPADLTPNTTANTFMSPISQSHPFQPRGRDIAVSSHEAMTSNASTGPISLNAALHGDVATAASAPVRPLRRDDDDDLFALPMSPRSPDMKKSPFSAL